MNPNQIPLFYLNHRTLSVNKVHAVDNSCPYARRRRPPPGPHGGQDSYDEAVICDCGAHKLIALIEDEVLADERPRTRQHLTTLRYNIAARLPCEVTYGFEYGKLMIRWKLRGVTVGREEFLVRVLEVEGRGFDRDDDEVKFSNVTEEEVEREAKAESDDVDFEEEDEGGKGGGGGGDDSIQNGALQSDGGGLENASMQNTDGETAELNVRGHGDDLDQNPDRDQSPSGTPGENASSTKLEDHDQSDADTESVSGVDIMEGHEFIRTSEDFWIFDDYKPATQYVVQIRADNAKAFFSVPFYFSIPPRPPANVSVSQQQQQQDSSLVQVIWDASEGADSYLVVFDDVDKESFEVDNGETRWSGIPPQGATHITVYSRCTALEHQSSGTTQPLRAPTPIPVPEPEVQPVSNSAEPILGPPVTDVIDAEPERESGGAHVPAEASQHEPGTSGRESAQTLVDTTSTMGSDDSAERSSAPSQQGFGTPSRQSTQTLVNATSAMDSDDGYDSDNEPFRSTFPSNSMDIDESILSFHMPPTFVPGESRGSRTDVDMPVPDEEPFERSESTNKRKRRPSLSRPSSPASPEPRRRRIDESAPFARIGDAEDLPDDYEGDSLDLESDGEHEEEEEILMMKTSLSEINVVQDSSAETTQASKQTNLSYHTVRGVQVTPGLIVQCSGPSGPSLIGQVRRITKKGTSVWIETVLYKPCKSHFTGWEDDRHLVLDVAFAAGPFNGVDSLPAIALEDDWFSHVERAKYQKIIHTNHTSASVDDSSFICPWAYISGEGHASYIRPILEVPSECTTQVRAKSLSAVNIFCGAGGVSVGFSQAGFNTVLGVDKDSSAISTFQRNFNSARVHFQPSEDFLADVLEKKLESPMPSVLIISPPCQSLESEGKHNRLTESIGAALQAYQPPYCVLFNSSRLIRKRYKSQFDSIVVQFLRNSYSLSYKLLTASDYQIPYSEKYLVIFAARSDLSLPEFPEASSGRQPPTVRDAIADLAFENNRGEVGKMSTDATGFVSYSPLPLEEGTYAFDLAESNRGQDGIYNHLTGYKPLSNPSNAVKVQFDQPAKSIKVLPGEKWACVHPERQDVLTVRELARLMSYPDSFVFQGKLKDQYKLVGSSVPPALAQACGEKIKERLFTQWPDLRPTPTS